MERPDSMDRKTSFNPKAAAFSPSTAPIKLAEMPNTTAGSRISALPRRRSYRFFRVISTNDMTEDSFVSLHTNNLEEANLALQQVSLEDLLSQGIPMDVLMRTFSGEWPQC
jgi:hypothetical protein